MNNAGGGGVATDRNNQVTKWPLWLSFYLPMKDNILFWESKIDPSENMATIQKQQFRNIFCTKMSLFQIAMIICPIVHYAPHQWSWVG